MKNMKNKLKNFFQKKYNLYLICAFISFILPITLFGNWNIFSVILFPISLVSIYFTINHRVIDGIKWPELLSSGLHGFFVGLFGISVLGMTLEGSLIHIVVWGGTIVYFLSAIPYIHSVKKFRELKKYNYDSQFKDSKSRKRDIKINKIFGK
jgi:hypothetical protein